MERFVKLDRLPEGLAVPPSLADRFHLDDEARRLVFRGFMSKAEFDRLSQLSEDWGYRRALEQLFQLCIDDGTEPPARGRGLRALLSRVGVP